MKPVELETERLTFSMPTPADAQRVFELCQDPAIGDFIIPIGRGYTLEKAQYFLAELVPHFWESGQGAEFAIRLKSDDSLVGMVGFSFDRNELGLWLGSEYRQHGYGFEACKRVIEWAKENSSAANAMVWSVMVGNSASIQLAKKLGFGFVDTSEAALDNGETVTMLNGRLGVVTEWPTP